MPRSVRRCRAAPARRGVQARQRRIGIAAEQDLVRLQEDLRLLRNLIVRVDTVPGEGVILAQVGRLVRDAQGALIFVAGQQDVATNNLGDFCTYMAS